MMLVIFYFTSQLPPYHALFLMAVDLINPTKKIQLALERTTLNQ
jgi:hypothetical protein